MSQKHHIGYKYLEARKQLGLTREKASELMPAMSPERIEKIENDKVEVRSEDVIQMARAYKYPELCNFFCANQCEIGKQYVKDITVPGLSRIVLEMLSSLNTIEKQKNRLIEISADEEITDEELEDFITIQDELSHISTLVSSLQLWTEKMVYTGKIDESRLNMLKERKSKKI